MITFRDLKPASVHNGARARHISGWYAALMLGDHVVWTGKTYLKQKHGPDAKQMALEDAKGALHCGCDSRMAEELTADLASFLS